MDKIGIKLADGSFYPILEDGKPEKKNISLTTVKDNQTTVHVDLFRSPSGGMEDAQYIDTLEIDNLNPHTNGDPNLSFDISLDEDGSLSAEIHDPETGLQSSRKVSISSLGNTVAEKLPARAPDLSLKDAEDADEPIELGHHKDTDEYVKEMEDIFKAPEQDVSEDEKADSSFDEIVNDISNIGKDADSQEENEVIGPSPNNESFAFDDFDGGTATKKDEVAKEPIEEISADEALPKDAEFVDSSGDEPLDMPETLGALDAGADQPDFGFKELADSSAAESASTESTAEPEAPVQDEDGFEELGTLPDWSTGGLEEGDDEELSSLPAFASDDTVVSESDEDKTADNDDNLDEENLELASFDAEGADDLSEPVVAASDETEMQDKSLPEELPPESVAEEAGNTEEEAEKTASAALESSGALDDGDDLDKLDLPSMNLFDESSPVTKSAASDDPWAGEAAVTKSSLFDEPVTPAEPAANDFELPDLGFDDAVTEEADTSFELPDFDHASSSASYAASSSAFDDFDSSLRSTSDWPSLDLDGDDASPASGESFTPDNMFDNLYDKETIEGKSSDGYEEEKRGTRVPMIICIACAIICILCLFFLFVIPTRFNVLRRDGSQAIAMNDKRSSSRPEGKSSVGGNEGSGITDSSAAGKDQSSAGDLIKPASTANVSAPLPKVESVPAKENEIVIATVPSVVVPETPVKNAKKIPDIQYKVVWGDTLWDIASAYYKNPWKYTVLAEYNHLKNPNFIQTGSILLIPAE